MKRLLSLAALLLIFVGFSWAYDFSAVAPTGQTLYYNIIGNAVQVTFPNADAFDENDLYEGFAQPTDTLTIPASVIFNNQSYPVMYIDMYTFSNCNGLTSVTIPNSVTAIGDQAFAMCTGLTSLDIPSSVESIGSLAFSHVRNIAYSGISTGSPWGALSVNGYVDGYLVYSSAARTSLLGCSTAATGAITIPNSVTSIGANAFYGCSGLTNITMPNSITSIGRAAFYSCRSLTNITIPNSVTSIDYGTFIGCSGLASVTIPNSVTEIGGGAFNGCSGLTRVDYTGTIADWCGISFGTHDANPLSFAHHLYIDNSEITNLVIPDSVTSIGNSAFCYCSGLTSVTIGNSVTSIGNSAFYYCSGLTSATIPNSVTCINNYAFQGCSGLTSVTIGNSVTSIGTYAFYGCGGLTEITSQASVAPQLGIDAFVGVVSTIPVNIPCGSISVASYVSRWPYFTNFIESSGFELSTASTDETKGTVQVLTAPTCISPNAVIYAVANSGYHFDHWSDGNTENPRTLVLTCDTNLLAYFAPDGGGEDIAEAEVANYAIRAVAGGIVIEGAAGREVRLYDIAGRLLRQLRADINPLQLEVSHGGIYLVQIDNHPAQRVVVVR